MSSKRKNVEARFLFSFMLLVFFWHFCFYRANIYHFLQKYCWTHCSLISVMMERQKFLLVLIFFDVEFHFSPKYKVQIFLNKVSVKSFILEANRSKTMLIWFWALESWLFENGKNLLSKKTRVCIFQSNLLKKYRFFYYCPQLTVFF